ncbi:MAG TPA: SRPBCC domain-containing protein [Phytomonospora sp.]
MTDDNTTEPLVIEVTVAAPPAVIWPALRDPELIRRWHGWHVDGLDEEIALIYGSDFTEDPEHHTLRLGVEHFSLHPSGDATIVRLTRAPRGAQPDWDAYYDDITEGWRTFLRQLRFSVERHGLADRRTLFLAGSTRGDAAELLGLGEAVSQPVGSGSKARLATGDAWSGEVWDSTDRQVFLTVAGHGDSLLVLARQPVTEFRPSGGWMILLNAYGFTDADFADLERRWSAWWSTITVPAG